jgi:hypothetical protein
MATNEDKPDNLKSKIVTTDPDLLDLIRQLKTTINYLLDRDDRVEDLLDAHPAV